MDDKCQLCGKCCLETEMILSQKEVDLILKFCKLKKEDFVFKVGEFYKLKNLEGHCFFFNHTRNFCEIYEYRPQGCRFYPLIYDKDNNSCIYDEECPRSHLFYQSKNDFKKMCKKLKKYVNEELNIDFIKNLKI